MNPPTPTPTPHTPTCRGSHLHMLDMYDNIGNSLCGSIHNGFDGCPLKALQASPVCQSHTSKRFHSLWYQWSHFDHIYEWQCIYCPDTVTTTGTKSDILWISKDIIMLIRITAMTAITTNKLAKTAAIIMMVILKNNSYDSHGTFMLLLFHRYYD